MSNLTPSMPGRHAFAESSTASGVVVVMQSDAPRASYRTLDLSRLREGLPTDVVVEHVRCMIDGIGGEERTIGYNFDPRQHCARCKKFWEDRA